MLLGGDGRGVYIHARSIDDLLAEAYARGHGLGESGGRDGSLRTIPLVRRAAEESLVENAFASAGLWLLAGWRAGLVLVAAWRWLAAWLPKSGLAVPLF